MSVQSWGDQFLHLTGEESGAQRQETMYLSRGLLPILQDLLHTPVARQGHF
jgi:hypothetical protein